LFSMEGSGGDATSFTEASPDEMARWEKLYYQKQAGYEDKLDSKDMLTAATGFASETRSPAEPIRVVTFDLDNTLWRTGPTITAANDALAEYLHTTHGVGIDCRVEAVMKELSTKFPQSYGSGSPSNKSITREVHSGTRAQGEESSNSNVHIAGAPVFLTRLRTDAIRHVLQRHARKFTDSNDLESAAQVAFEFWTDFRHNSTLSHLAADVESCLEKIRCLHDVKTDSDQATARTAGSGSVIIGAVTDGNSDPQRVAQLARFFDFCINAENVGVAKPNAAVYRAAIDLVRQKLLPVAFSHNEVNEDSAALGQASARAKNDNDLTNQDPVGGWWVHVGDDFVKDIVAAKCLGMRTIWCRELIRDKLPQAPKYQAPQERSVEEFVRAISSSKDIRMTIGADDYLVSQMQEEFADAVVDRFADIADVLALWNGNQASPSPSKVSRAGSIQNAAPRCRFGIGTAESARAASSSSPSRSSAIRSLKFCIHCGCEAPIEAKFCPSCGEKHA
jgi:FMN phosphatase YigB (HAD superfamily)